MFVKMKLFTAFLLILCPLGALCTFNMTKYRQMPPLYDLDDYDECLENSRPSSYCLVIGEIEPNDTSVLWHQIANFSAVFKRHYRHDYLYFGVCLNPCKELVHRFSPFRKDQLYAGNIKNTELVEFYTDVSRHESDTRIRHNKVINTCLNYKFEKQYNLRVRSFIEYCVKNDDPSNFDYLEIIFTTVVGAILLLVALSSTYDRLLKRAQPEAMRKNEFYQQKLHSIRDNVLTSFSMYRNYYRLILPSHSNVARDFRFLECYRFFATLLVVFAHVLLFLKGIPVRNTQFIEETFYKLESNIIINGSVVIQVFLVMSSFLMCIGFQRTMALKKPGVAEWGTLVLYRYLRLAPSLAFVILLNASILPRLQDGPFWRHVVDSESILCRETWWSNLLFINNFTLKKSCLHQSWYLATDFQLYVIFAAKLIFIVRFPQTRNYILGTGVAISFLSTGLVTYFFKLDAIHQETPNSYRYNFWSDGDTIYKGYTPFYTNFGGFVFGTIAAFVYLKYKNEGVNLKAKKSKLNTILFISIPLPFLLLLSGEIFYRFEFEKPSIWVGIYSGLYRNIWALMCATIILLMTFKVGLLMYKFSSLKIYLPLGRLSFQVFLIHTVVIRCLTGCIRQPEHLNIIIVTMYVLASIVLSFFAAFFLYLFVELPMTNLVHTFQRCGTDKTDEPTKTFELNQSRANNNMEETTTTTTLDSPSIL